MLTKVTITGADDSINPKELEDLWFKYPFVEWGILISRKNFGFKRFPSLLWLEDLIYKRLYCKISCHLCGEYVREFLRGNANFIKEIGNIWKFFERVQLNTHGEIHEFSPDLALIIKKYDNKEFIFQIDNVNTNLFKTVLLDPSFVNVSTLFDLSHGAGLLPNRWPAPLNNIKCGYAGGLSPENLEKQINLIEQKAGDREIWIDMETHVRSNSDKLFDLNKVLKCLEICKHYVKINTNRYSNDFEIQKFLNWLYKKNPITTLRMLETPMRYGIHPYLEHEFKAYCKEFNLKATIELTGKLIINNN